MNLTKLRNWKQIQRPPAVTWLAGLVFLLGIANLCIVVIGLARRAVFDALPLSISLVVLMILGGLWAVVWIEVAWGLFHLKRWARVVAPILFGIYETVTIGRQAFFAQEVYARGRLGFTLILGILLLGFMILILVHPQVRESFNRSQSTTSTQT